MPLTAEQIAAFERLLAEVKTPEEQIEAAAQMIQQLNDAIEDRDWVKVSNLGIELLTNAVYLSFLDDITDAGGDAK